MRCGVGEMKEWETTGRRERVKGPLWMATFSLVPCIPRHIHTRVLDHTLSRSFYTFAIHTTAVACLNGCLSLHIDFISPPPPPTLSQRAWSIAPPWRVSVPTLFNPNPRVDSFTRHRHRQVVMPSSLTFL